MTTKNKPIGLSFIDQKVKNANKKEKFYLDENKENFIHYFPIFSKKKIDDLLTELMTTIQYCKSNNLEYLSNDAEILQYTNFLIIKYFTSLHTELKDKSFEIHIDTLEKLYDSEMYDLFLAEMFNDEQLTKVIDKLYEVNELANKYEKVLKEQKLILDNKIQNKVLKNKLS